MHQITGYYFFTHKDGRKFVVYSTLYKSGRYASLHDCTGLSDEQARGRFLVEHSEEVDRLIRGKKVQEQKSKIILNH